MSYKKNVKIAAVFGSLRRGLWNNHILENAKYLGDTKTAPVFTMKDFGNFPGLLHTGKTEVLIEVYEVEDDATWERLDMLEGYPNFYNRMIIETEYGFAWIYYNPLTKEYQATETIADGDWVKYEKTKRDKE